jgi:uncharacterized protein (DUF2267 family)
LVGGNSDQEATVNYTEFINLVRKRARLETESEALLAIEATLKTLSERIGMEEAEELAAQLPQGIREYLTQEQPQKSFGLDEFYNKVSIRSSVGFPEVERHARAVISVVSETATAGEIDDVLSRLPEEYIPLFTFGGDGEYRHL